MKHSVLVKCLFLLLIMVFVVGCKANKHDYGLVADGIRFVNSFYLENSKLRVGNQRSFENEFNSNEFKRISDEVKSHPKYMQSEVIFLPIIQRVTKGKNVVFIFERAYETKDFTNFERIAIECKDIDARVLSFPSVCSGYYLIDTNNWPPTISDISFGSMEIYNKDRLAGFLSGKLDVAFEDGRIIKGDFSVFDKFKRIFLNTPARY